MSSSSPIYSANLDSNPWTVYFGAQPDYDAMLFDDKSYIKRIEQLSPILFNYSTDVEIIQSSTDSDRTTRTQLQDENSLTQQLSQIANPRLRIISIPQAFSLSPFKISEISMCEILTHHHIPPGFLDILCGFGDKSTSEDEGSASGVYSSFNETSHDIFYQFWYVEKNNRKHGNPWSVRQTGVYHRFSSPGKVEAVPENLWLLLHPMPHSKAQTRLGAATDKISTQEMALDPLRPHVLIMSSYIDNWRWYLHDIKRHYLELEDMLMTTELREDHGLNFNTLQTLRHLASKLIPIPTMLQSAIATIASIQAMNNQLHNRSQRIAETAHHLRSCSSRLQGYGATAEVLQKRIENMTKFLADGLNLQNQDISADSNNHLLTLTKDTVEDSATVRAVTLVTLIYLPASFLSGLFGMNLFNFNNSTTALEISNQFWIYVAAMIPLTILTLGYWKYKTWQKRKLKQKRESAAKLPPV